MRIKLLSPAEICQFKVSSSIHQDVIGLDVAVNDAHAMDSGNGSNNRMEDLSETLDNMKNIFGAKEITDNGGKK